MGAWVLDYLTNWVGEWGDVLHSNVQYRSPAFTGDVTYLDGEVTAINQADSAGQPIASVRVIMSNQNGEIMASGDAELRLPTETLPAE
jgi:acyl dehydratase